ncbi:MAG: hypothetical protein GY810_08610 [Aureispira sp.]|nr:hypothetical protein [Aureispira sp.]
MGEAQVGINIMQPDTCAILHLESTDKGFLPPRMTTQQRDSIYAPKAGLIVYNNEDSVLQYYTGECWMNAWQKTCDECILEFGVEKQTGTIDRIVSNDDSTRLFINQINGTQPVTVLVLPTLPSGLTASLNKLTVNGTDTLTLTVTADIFTPPGTYPVVVQAICGSSTYNQAFVVTVEPCIEVDINTPQLNYNLQVANNLPTNQPICVVARIAPGVQMSNDSISPVFNTGNLHSQSRVGILNGGDMLGKGGNGGAGAGLQGQSGEGGDGTHAINLTVHTHIINNGRIFGGGGGGGSVGFEVSVPIVGNLGVGAGGGGGAQGGLGGNVAIGILYEPGTDATTGAGAANGVGGLLNVPISIPLGPATVDITPNAYGGDGGGYGLPGAMGFLFVNLKVSVPFIGTIFNQDFPDPPLTVFPAGGEAGFAVKRNGNVLIGLTNGNYQTSNIKGQIGN